MTMTKSRNHMHINNSPGTVNFQKYEHASPCGLTLPHCLNDNLMMFSAWLCFSSFFISSIFGAQCMNSNDSKNILSMPQAKLQLRDFLRQQQNTIEIPLQKLLRSKERERARDIRTPTAPMHSNITREMQFQGLGKKQTLVNMGVSCFSDRLSPI